MYGQNKKDLVEIIKKLCEMKSVQLLEGKVCVDHIHMYVAIPPKLSVSEFMSYLKGKSFLIGIQGFVRNIAIDISGLEVIT